MTFEKARVKLALMLGAVATLTAAASAAEADTYLHGSICTTRGAVLYNQYGAFSDDMTSTAGDNEVVTCALPHPDNGLDADVTVNVYDRDSARSLDVDWCATDQAGSSVACTHASTGTSFTGYASLVLPEPQGGSVRYLKATIPDPTTLGYSHLVSIIKHDY